MNKTNFRSLLTNTVVAILLFTTITANTQTRFGGLALYTVRDAMASDPAGTLKLVADAGYQYIEGADYKDGQFYNMSPKSFKALTKKLNLIPLSSHQGTVTMDNSAEMMANVKAAGFSYFVIPVPPMGLFKFDRNTRSMGMTGSIDNLADILTALGKKANAAGLKLLYHNHDFEFKKDENGIVPIEYLLENTRPEFVNFQLDLYWVIKAGADPIEYFEKYPGRFTLWHVKDMDADGNFAPVGNGTIDFVRILEKKELSGMENYLVEQDRTFNMTPLEAIRISHEGLKMIGFK